MTCKYCHNPAMAYTDPPVCAKHHDLIRCISYLGRTGQVINDINLRGVVSSKPEISITAEEVKPLLQSYVFNEAFVG